MSVYLDVTIAVILVFFALSLVVTALNEVIAVLLNLRGRFLLGTIRMLVDDPDLLERMLGAAPIRLALRTRRGRDVAGAGRFPDHLPPLAVADALLAAAGPPRAATLAQTNTPPTLVSEILDAAREAAADTRDALAATYAEAMDQLSVRYRRHQQVLSVILGIGLAASFNINVVDLAGTLRRDADLRSAFAAEFLDLDKTYADGPAAGGREEIVPSVVATAANRIEALDALSRLGGLGWRTTPWEDVRNWNWTERMSALCAWLIAGVASVLGAPFWFDLLNRAIRVRESVSRNRIDTDAT